MPDGDYGELVKRLDRMEESLERFRLLVDLLNPVDPPPDDIARTRLGGDILNARLADVLRDFIRRRPHGDPPPDDLTRGRGSLFEARLGDILQRNPGWFTDPPPDDFLNVRVLDLIRRWRGGFTDPAPDDLANVRLRDLLQRVPGGGITDPPPEDLGRLTQQEIETQLHKINVELVRLQSLQRLYRDRLNQFKAE